MSKFILILIIAILGTHNNALSEFPPQELLKPKNCDYIHNWTEECQDINMQFNYGKHWKKFKEAYFDFHKAFNNNDRIAIAKMIRYPIEIEYVKVGTLDHQSPRDYKALIINNEEEFLKKYDFIFGRNSHLLGTISYTRLGVLTYYLSLSPDNGGIEFAKACDFSKISQVECDVVKITKINNDIITEENRYAAIDKEYTDRKANPTPENIRWLKCRTSKYEDTDDCVDLRMETKLGIHWKEYKTAYFKFKEAFEKNDRKVVAAMMNFPLGLLYPEKNAQDNDWPRKIKSIDIKNEKEFLKKYDFIFTKRLKEMIKQFEYRDLIVDNFGYRAHYQYGGIAWGLENCQRIKGSINQRYDANTCKDIKIDYINNDIVPLD